MNSAAHNNRSLPRAPEARQEPSGQPEFLGRCRDAFSETRDTRFFHAGACAAAALEALLTFVNDTDSGVAIVVAEPGCGKSLLRTELHRRLSAEGHACVALENGWLDFDGIVLEIISQLQSTRVESTSGPITTSGWCRVDDTPGPLFKIGRTEASTARARGSARPKTRHPVRRSSAV